MNLFFATILFLLSKDLHLLGTFIFLKQVFFFLKQKSKSFFSKSSFSKTSFNSVSSESQYIISFYLIICDILYSYHQGDLITPFKPMMYPPRLFSISASSSTLPPPPLMSYLYPPPSPPRPPRFPHCDDFYLHNNGTHHQTLTNSGCRGRAPPDSSYSFIGGAPVANGSRVAPLLQPLPPHHGL